MRGEGTRPSGEAKIPGAKPIRRLDGSSALLDARLSSAPDGNGARTPLTSGTVAVPERRDHTSTAVAVPASPLSGIDRVTARRPAVHEVWTESTPPHADHTIETGITITVESEDIHERPSFTAVLNQVNGGETGPFKLALTGPLGADCAALIIEEHLFDYPGGTVEVVDLQRAAEPIKDDLQTMGYDVSVTPIDVAPLTDGKNDRDFSELVSYLIPDPEQRIKTRNVVKHILDRVDFSEGEAPMLQKLRDALRVLQGESNYNDNTSLSLRQRYYLRHNIWAEERLESMRTSGTFDDVSGSIDWAGADDDTQRVPEPPPGKHAYIKTLPSDRHNDLILGEAAILSEIQRFALRRNPGFPGLFVVLGAETLTRKTIDAASRSATEAGVQIAWFFDPTASPMPDETWDTFASGKPVVGRMGGKRLPTQFIDAAGGQVYDDNRQTGRSSDSGSSRPDIEEDETVEKIVKTKDRVDGETVRRRTTTSEVPDNTRTVSSSVNKSYTIGDFDAITVPEINHLGPTEVIVVGVVGRNGERSNPHIDLSTMGRTGARIPLDVALIAAFPDAQMPSLPKPPNEVNQYNVYSLPFGPISRRRRRREIFRERDEYKKGMQDLRERKLAEQQRAGINFWTFVTRTGRTRGFKNTTDMPPDRRVALARLAGIVAAEQSATHPFPVQLGDHTREPTILSYLLEEHGRAAGATTDQIRAVVTALMYDRQGYNRHRSTTIPLYERSLAQGEVARPTTPEMLNNPDIRTTLAVRLLDSYLERMDDEKSEGRTLTEADRTIAVAALENAIHHGMPPKDALSLLKDRVTGNLPSTELSNDLILLNNRIGANAQHGLVPLRTWVIAEIVRAKEREAGESGNH